MDISTLEIGGLRLRVATSQGNSDSVPLLLFNGLGANLELLRGFADEMQTYGIGVVTFDIPGTGGSSQPRLPYRLWHLARLANKVLRALGITGPVDVGGVSWGGAVAQEFARHYPRRARRLLLAATTAGVLAVPGRWSALSKMIVPRRYSDPAYLSSIGATLYGGKFRDDPNLLDRYGSLIRPPKGVGYYYQLLAVSGWTSVPWLWRLRQQTLVMMGTDDPIVPVINGRILAGLIPNAHLVTIRDGHLFLVTSRSECAPIIARFLRDGIWPSVIELAAS
jgi:poly(3-hydroxyalkanoate) depolymerase